MKRMKIVQIVNNNFHCSEYIVTVLQPKKLYLKQGYTKYHIMTSTFMAKINK